MSIFDAPEAEDRPTGLALLLCGIEHAAAFAFGVFLALLALVSLRDLEGVWILLGLASAAVLLPMLAGYTFARPFLDLRRSVTFGVLAPIGFLLPVGASLTTAHGPGPGPWIELLFGVCLAATCNLTLRTGILASHMVRGRPWLRRAVPSIALIPLISLSGIITRDRHDPLSRMDLAIEVYGQLWEYYPHWQTAPLKPGDLWAKYRSRLEAADTACGMSEKPCAPYLHALRDMFAELQNGHTEVLVPEGIGSPPIEVDRIEDKAVVTHVSRGSEAAAAGVEIGAEILEVDGVPVETALRRIPEWRVAFTSRQTRTLAAYHALLEGPAGSTVQIRVANPGSAPRIVTLGRPPVRYDWELPNDASGGSELHAHGGRFAGDPAYVHLDGFEGEGLEERFDQALDRALDAPGLILDLRANYGGILDHAFRMMGRFFVEPVTIGEHCLPAKEGHAEPECTVHRIEPRGRPYRGPLAVLIDENVYSAGELAAYALCRTGRARCFGRTTAGETDCVFRLDLPGAVARMSWADFRPSMGSDLLGTGLDPDVRIEKTIDDLRAGRDPELTAARAWLLTARDSATTGPIAAQAEASTSQGLEVDAPPEISREDHAR